MYPHIICTKAHKTCTRYVHKNISTMYGVLYTGSSLIPTRENRGRKRKSNSRKDNPPRRNIIAAAAAAATSSLISRAPPKDIGFCPPALHQQQQHQQQQLQHEEPATTLTDPTHPLLAHPYTYPPTQAQQKNTRGCSIRCSLHRSLVSPFVRFTACFHCWVHRSFLLLISTVLFSALVLPRSLFYRSFSLRSLFYQLCSRGFRSEQKK